MRKIFLFLLLPVIGFSQSASVLKVRAYRQSNEHELISDYRQFLGIPNVAADIDNIQRNATWIMNHMRAKGIAQVQLLNGRTPNKPPAVCGEVIVPGAK